MIDVLLSISHTGDTLGVLNFVDRLWPSCGEERIIVLTTNHKDRVVVLPCCGPAAWTCTSTWASSARRHSTRLRTTTTASRTTGC